MLGIALRLGMGGALRAGRSWNADFTSGLPAIFTHSRTGTRYARASNLRWAAYASDVARLHHDPVGAPLGIVFEKSYVDKTVLGTNLAAAPTDTTGSFFNTPTNVSRVASSLGLEGTGWEDLITAVLRFDNSAGGSSLLHQLDGLTGNTNKHSLQAFTRDTSGTGLTLSGFQISGGTVVSVSSFGTWEQVVSENQTPTSTTRLFQVVTRANRVQDLALAIMTESPYCPLPYLHPTDNVAVTLGNEYASAPVSSIPVWSTTELAIGFEWFHEWPCAVDNEPLFAIAKASSPSTDYVRLVGMADGTLKINMVVGGVSVFSSTFAAPTRRTVCRAAIRLKSGNFMAAVNGVGGTVSTSAGDWSGFDTVYINRLDTAYSNSIVRTIASTSNSLGDAALVAASSSNDGGFI